MSNHATLERRLRELRASSGRKAYDDLLNVARGVSRVVSDDASLVTVDGLTVNSTVYQIDYTAGDVLIGGHFESLALANDQDLLVDISSWNLDGSPAAAIADLNSVWIMLAAIIVSGAVEVHAVFGAEAPTGNEVKPTPAQVREALSLAMITGHNASGLGIIFAEINAARSGGAVTFTHSNPATDDVVKGRRLASALGG